MIHFILGGARSGKSAFAQQLATRLHHSTHSDVTYVATATALDKEMADRIQRHQEDRPTHWQLAEVPLALTQYLARVSQTSKPILLVDCLTLWLNNQLYQAPDQDFGALFDELITALQQSSADIILVANEVGLGVIPMGEISRAFVDQAGWLNQRIAHIADEVTFVAAGLPMPLKSP